ncbi:hypothetical protein NHF40_03245 [Maricaulaceae bacterium EIL42A08]|nr:hypothetical protein [Maricaulaceae bacterium EIL42A08]MCP2679822.1 hypothetical protein [Maricaulaceae bacterium NA33B04]
MSKTNDTSSKGSKPGKAEPTEKEKRLADALRANLRRRKAPPKPSE